MRRVQALTGVGLVAAAAACVGAAFMASYTWTGNCPTSDSWGCSCNWGAVFCDTEDFPNNATDDATIPFTSGGYPVDLIEEQIRHLTMQGDVTFGGGNVTLSVATYTIDATESAVDVDIVMGDRPQIIANAP